MPDLNIVIRKGKAAPGKSAFRTESPEDNRYGFWGMVTELHPENNTVRVRTPEGRIISNVRVSSSVWVTVDKDKGFLSGLRYMPPVDTFVLVFMPNGKYSSAVVIASGFSDDPRHKSFMGKSEDKKEICEGILNSGWMFAEDNRTGTRALQNKPEDPTVKIEFDQESEGDERLKITIHKNVFNVDKESGIKIQTDKNIIVEADKDTKISVKGNASISADGNIEAKAGGDVSIKADGNAAVESAGNAEVKAGGNLKAEATGNADVKGINATVEASALLTLKSGDAAPWMPNCVPTCPFGMPHGGASAGIAKLKGG